MSAPILTKTIPLIAITEGSAYGPLNLREFIEAEEGGNMHFIAGISEEAGLPAGLICTMEGFLTGIPAKGTQGNYTVMLNVANEDGELNVEFPLTIKPAYTTTDSSYLDQIKKQVWEAIGEGMPAPDLSELYNRPLTDADIQYLLERWGILKIWDAFNLDPPGERVPLELAGASKHYGVYDRGSCLVAAPKDLFSHERTLQDGIMTAQAMARHVYDLEWTVELVGYRKFTRAAWLEIQHMDDKYGTKLDIVNYRPSAGDLWVYGKERKNRTKYGPE